MNKVDELIIDAERDSREMFSHHEEIALYNQQKVLQAFKDNKVALRHFSGTTGYGYDDIGKNTLSACFAQVFGAESALVSPLISGGTHAISIALFGLLLPGMRCLSATGTPYDTMQTPIFGKNVGSLRDLNVEFDAIELANGEPDFAGISNALKEKKYDLIYVQRSRGYNWRKSLTIADIAKIVATVREFCDAPILVDNCYGEFMEKQEPTEVGANIIVGSLIKNPGGGLAPTGGYIAGDEKLIKKIEGRYSAPGLGFEVGSYMPGYQLFYQGLFMAPHTVLQAVKGSILFGRLMDKIGYETLPLPNEPCADIIRSIKFKTADELIAFCQAIQANSPIDSHVVPMPWDMPGYENQVIMAAGAFNQGASIELSADAPIREPYILYLQGALTYEHAKIAAKACIESIL